MLITVTEHDIAHGQRDNGEACPLALALCRCGWAKRPCVLQWFAYDAWEPRGVIRLPPEARLFVADFDHGLPVHPFTFEIKDLT